MERWVQAIGDIDPVFQGGAGVPTGRSYTENLALDFTICEHRGWGCTSARPCWDERFSDSPEGLLDAVLVTCVVLPS